MTKKGNTKKALLMSALSLLLCVSMLVGTTFAWFTDSITSGTNKIVAGNLDVDLYHSDKAATNKEVDSNTKLFDDVTLWEPGAMVWEKLTVTNAGNLDLKYSLKINITDISNVNGKSLADVLKVAVMDTQPTRDNIKTAETQDLASFALSSDKALTDGSSDEFYVAIYWAPSSNDNDYNVAGEALYAHLGVTLLATQYTSEADSFDDQYDKDASYPGQANTANELIAALKAGKNVTLGDDIDLAGVEWTPIASYSGTFDGAGHTISNLKGENGLFETIDGATIKNLKLENVKIDATSYYTGAIAGSIAKNPAATTIIDNVTVSGSINGGDYYTGGLIGASSAWYATISNCVNNADVTASGQQVGGILGYAKRNTVVDSCVNNGDVEGGLFVGGILGLAAGDDENPDLSVIVKNCKNTGDISETNVTHTWAGSVGDIVGFVGREGGKTPSVMTTFYFIDNTVREGQKIYGRIGNVSGGTDYITVYAGDSISAGDAVAIMDAVKAIGANESKTFFLTDGEYTGNIDLTVAALGADKFGDIAFVAAPGTNPVITGTVTMGYYENRVGQEAFNAHITFEGITFEHAEGGAHSLVAENLGSRINDGRPALTLNKCKIIGHGDEYGIGSVSGSIAFNSRITNCTFENAAIQAHGNLGTGLVIENCTFTESVINAQAGNGFTVKGCTFTNTLTDAHNDKSFYVVRASSATPIMVIDCIINVDSTVTGVGVAGTKGWGVFVNRNSKDITVTDVKVYLTDAALAQTALKVGEKLSSGKIITTNLTVNGAAYTIDAAQ